MTLIRNINVVGSSNMGIPRCHDKTGFSVLPSESTPTVDNTFLVCQMPPPPPPPLLLFIFSSFFPSKPPSSLSPIFITFFFLPPPNFFKSCVYIKLILTTLGQHRIYNINGCGYGCGQNTALLYFLFSGDITADTPTSPHPTHTHTHAYT